MPNRIAKRGFGSPSSKLATPQQNLSWMSLSARRHVDLMANFRGGGSYLDEVIKAVEADDSVEFTRLCDN